MTAAPEPSLLDKFAPCGECSWCRSAPAPVPQVDQGSGGGWSPTPRDSCWARFLRVAALGQIEDTGGPL